jgi:1-acyl-sn-glycerol-3-phosphate acyltransferase
VRTRAPAPEPRLPRLLRRSLTIPAYALAGLLWIAVAPIALPLLALSDRLGGGPTARARLAVFAGVFLFYECVGLAAAGVLWLAGLVSPRFRGARSVELHRRLQLWWSMGLFRGASRILRLSLEVELDGDATLAPGPLVVLIRHASLADSLLPSVLLGARGWKLRYVLKSELLWDPCLDVVGQRIPNAFIRRGSGESATEIEAVAALGRNLARDEGVVIYPEGTRYTPAKHARAIVRIAARNDPDLLARAQALESVLPPRSAGTLALIEAAADADVLVVAHSGLEGLATVRDIVRVGASTRRIRVRLWRVPRAGIPDSRESRVRWLHDEWARVDAFVTAATR